MIGLLMVRGTYEHVVIGFMLVWMVLIMRNTIQSNSLCYICCILALIPYLWSLYLQYYNLHPSKSTSYHIPNPFELCVWE